MSTSAKINKREDVDPIDAEREYGEAEFADAVNKKYPIDTPERVQASWAYINREENAVKYNEDAVELIKQRIREAAREFDIELAGRE